MTRIHGLRCWICGKKKVFGRSVSHSGVRTARVFKPNLQWKKVVMNGQKVRMRVCTRCIKRLKKPTYAEATPSKQLGQVEQVSG